MDTVRDFLEACSQDWIDVNLYNTDTGDVIRINLMDMDDDDFANKYGLFKWQNIVPGLKLVLLSYVDGTWNPTEFKATKAGQRIVASGFPIAPENGFGVGRNGFEVTRHIVRNGAYPVPNYFIATAYSSNLQQKWDMIHHQYSTYNLTNFNPA